jgi:F0F1-type ATP synthase assembly protein I
VALPDSGQNGPNAGVSVNHSQRREITKSMYRSSGSYELVMSPLLLALLGFLVDRWLGTTPFITAAAAVIGFAGACVKLYFGYKTEMDEHEANAPWAKRS